MTGKEAILAAMSLTETERAPAMYFGGGMWTAYQAGETLESLAADAKHMAEVIIRIAEEIQNPIVYCGSGYNNLLAAAVGGKLKYRPHGAPDIVEPALRDWAELDTLDATAVDRNDTVNTIWKATEIVARRIGDRFMVTTTSWGPFTLASQICGMEPLMRGTFREKDRIHQLLAFAAELIYRYYDPLLTRGTIETVCITDSVASGSLISRKQFAEFALPPLQQFTRKMRRKGVKTLLHICGDTNDRLDLLPETGADIISIDTNTDLAKAREATRGKLCLGGNLSPVTLMLQGTPKMIEAQGRTVIESLGRGGGFILMPGCDIAANAPRPNVEALLRTAAATPVA